MDLLERVFLACLLVLTLVFFLFAWFFNSALLTKQLVRQLTRLIILGNLVANPDNAMAKVVMTSLPRYWSFFTPTTES